MANGTVDGYELAAQTRGTAHDLRTDANLPLWHGRKANFGTLVGGHVWRATYTWDPRTERVVAGAQVDTVASENLVGQPGA